MPIATPMSARPESRRVVDPVSGHRDHIALALQQVDEAHLVFRRDPGDHAEPREPIHELGVAERGELRAAECLALDPELSADRGRGGDMVTGDHAYADARLLAEGDGVARLPAWGIHDPHQGEQREVVHLVEQVPARVERRGIEVPRRHGQDPEPVTGQAVVRLQDAVPSEFNWNVLAFRSSRHR
jgi:hypothetical protein